jgi:peroxiredoxin
MAGTWRAETAEAVFQRARQMDAPLEAQLEAIAAGVRAASPAFADTVERLIERLQRSGAGDGAPRPGERLPSFLLPEEGGRLVALEDLLAGGPLAVVFHRGHWCPYCRLNSVALAQAQRQAAAFGGRMVAITPDRPHFTAMLKAETAAPFPILTDLDNGYALSLNLVIWLGREMKDALAAAGRDLPRYQGNESWMLPIPATFVVGADGVIRARHVDPDYRKRMAIADLLAALAAAGEDNEAPTHG